MSFRYNPYAWGFINSGGIVTSRNVITYFSHPNGVEIPVNQLEDGDRVRMLLGQADDYDASGMICLKCFRLIRLQLNKLKYILNNNKLTIIIK